MHKSTNYSESSQCANYPPLRKSKVTISYTHEIKPNNHIIENNRRNSNQQPNDPEVINSQAFNNSISIRNTSNNILDESNPDKYQYTETEKNLKVNLADSNGFLDNNKPKDPKDDFLLRLKILNTTKQIQNMEKQIEQYRKYYRKECEENLLEILEKQRQRYIEKYNNLNDSFLDKMKTLKDELQEANKEYSKV